jgi:hypothetical protein
MNLDFVQKFVWVGALKTVNFLAIFEVDKSWHSLDSMLLRNIFTRVNVDLYKNSVFIK